MKKRFWITLLLLFPISFASISLAQNTQESRTYFPGNYSTQPIITFKEGFLNQTTYYLDGQKSNPAEVAALLNSVQSEEFRFSAYQRKKNWGTAMNLTGLAVSIGSVAYLFTNEITPANVRPWFWVTFGGGVVQGTGSILIRDADRRIRRSINDFNAYHYSGGADAFLSMDIMDGFLGP